MQGGDCGERDAGRGLWGKGCRAREGTVGKGMTGGVCIAKRMRDCGTVVKWMRGRDCGRKGVERGLWEGDCREGTVERGLWGKGCGERTVGRGL